MKKAKIVLSAVALFAVVGGAFAFKAMRLPSNVYTSYLTTTAPGGPSVTRCAPAPYISTATGNLVTSVYYSTQAGNICTSFVPNARVIQAD